MLNRRMSRGWWWLCIIGAMLGYLFSMSDSAAAASVYRYTAQHVTHKASSQVKGTSFKRASVKVNGSIFLQVNLLDDHQKVYMDLAGVSSLLAQFGFPGALERASTLHVMHAGHSVVFVALADIMKVMNDLHIEHAWYAHTHTLSIHYQWVSFISAQLTNSPLYSNVPSYTSITVTVLDHEGSPMASQLVSVTSKNPSIATVPASAITNSQGQVVVPVNAGSVAGSTQIVVSAGALKKSLSVTTTIDQPAKMTISSPNALVAGGTSSDTLEVTVQDASGVTLPQDTVTATSADSQVATITPSAVTGPNGIASLTVTSGTKAGMATLTFQVGSVTQTANVQVTPGSPASVVLQSGVTSIPADPSETATIQAGVADAYGNPVPNATVQFTSSAPNVLSVTPNAVTGADGIATVTVTPTKEQGSAQIQASISGVTSSPITMNAVIPVQPGSELGLYDPNSATNDSVYWQRKSNDFYLSAQSNDPLTNSSGVGATSLLNAEPGQSLYLFAWLQSGSLDAQTSWHVNSPDASMTTSSKHWYYTVGGVKQTVAGATFVASQPGIYTVQAEDQGQYSVPLVITVGMNQLASQPFANTGLTTGIEPLPVSLPATPSTTSGSVTYVPYPVMNGWIPISGSTTLPIQHMTVILQGQSQSWNYELPVQNGQFSGLVRSPDQGTVQVTFFPNYFQTMTTATDQGTGFSYPSSSYQVQVTTAPPESTMLALFASAHRNYNMSTNIANAAALLLENSTSMDTAIQAISNYATESIIYNVTSATISSQGLAPYYVWQDTLKALTTHSGVCEDYSSLAAALLESVGIPAQTVGGFADPTWTTLPATDSNPADSHQWTQAWDGTHWLVFDPTWGTDDLLSPVSYIENEFFSHTASFQVTHLITTGLTGTWQ